MRISLPIVMVLLLLLNSCDQLIDTSNNSLQNRDNDKGLPAGFEDLDLASQLIYFIPKGAKIAVIDPIVKQKSYEFRYQYMEFVYYSFNKSFIDSIYIVDFTEDLINQLIIKSNNSFIVFERNIIEKALSELNFQSSDLFEQKKSREFGKFLGADFVVTGTISVKEMSQDYSDRIRFEGSAEIATYLRVINIESLEIIGAATEKKNLFFKERWPISSKN